MRFKLKCHLIVLLVLCNMSQISVNRAYAADPATDAILAIIAQWFQRAANIIKIVGEGYLAELKLRGDKALISAKKNNVTSISKTMSELSNQELIRYGLDNTGITGRVASVRFDASGRRVRDLFWVSAIAPSGCIAKSKSRAFGSVVEEINNFNLSMNNSFHNIATTKIKNNNSQIIEKETKVFNQVHNGMKNHKLGLYPSPLKQVVANEELVDYMSSLASLFSFANLPLDLSKAESGVVNQMIQSNEGGSWLAYQLMAKGLYDVTASGFNKNIVVNNDGEQTTQAKEELKDYHYANSFKRTLASQVKSSAGNIMEINYLLNRMLDSKIKEHADLVKQQKLLEIISMQRVREYRSQF